MIKLVNKEQTIHNDSVGYTDYCGNLSFDCQEDYINVLEEWTYSGISIECAEEKIREKYTHDIDVDITNAMIYVSYQLDV